MLAFGDLGSAAAAAAAACGWRAGEASPAGMPGTSAGGSPTSFHAPAAGSVFMDSGMPDCPGRYGMTTKAPVTVEATYYSDAAPVAKVVPPGPGRYVMTTKTPVTMEAIYRADAAPVAKVAPGTVVDVLEVTRSDVERRIRGRIAEPKGWINLFDTVTGRRWATRTPRCPQDHEFKRGEATCKGICSNCHKPFQPGELLLFCGPCEYSKCSHCAALEAPAQAWTRQLHADKEVEDLGLVHTAVPPARAVLRCVKPGSWAHASGARDGDEILAVNGTSVDQMTAEVLDIMLTSERPLRLLIAHMCALSPAEASPEDSSGHMLAHPRQDGRISTAGADMTEEIITIRELSTEDRSLTASKSLLTTSSGEAMRKKGNKDVLDGIILRMTVQNLSWAALSSDPGIVAAFEDAVRRSVAAEADNGLEADHIEVGISADLPLVIRCLVRPPHGTSANAVRLELSRSRSIGQTVAKAVNALEAICKVALGTVQVTEVAVEVGAARPQLLEDGCPMPPHLCGVTRAQCAELLEKLRQDSTWKASNSMHALVTDFVVPMTRGTGRSYALCKNGDEPKEVSVMVAHAWEGNAEEFLECVLRSTTEDDVLFICALSLYQAEDRAGPTVAEQLGPNPDQGPFQKVLSHIRARGLATGWWRWRCRGLVRALPLLPLSLALLLFYGPIIYWGCVPDLDLSRCAALAPVEAGMEAAKPSWTWLDRYQLDFEQIPNGWREAMPAGYGLVLFLLLLALLSWWALCRRSRTFNGRLLVVPNREVLLCDRLWCMYHILAARSTGVPVVMAESLARIGRCNLQGAACASPYHCDRLLREIDEKAGQRRATRSVCWVIHCWQWSLALTVLRWALLEAVLRCADVRLGVHGPLWDIATNQPLLPLLCVLGATVGILLYFLLIYKIVRRSNGRPSWQSMTLCALSLLLVSAGTMALLIHAQVLRRVDIDAWTEVIPLLAGEGFTYVSAEGCDNVACQHAAAVVTGFCQSLATGGVALALLLPGGLCCPVLLGRHRRRALLFAATSLIAVACAVVVLEAVLLAPKSGGIPAGAIALASELWFPATVLRVTQLLARCAVPAGAVWASAVRFGAGVNVGRRMTGRLQHKSLPKRMDDHSSWETMAGLEERPWVRSW